MAFLTNLLSIFKRNKGKKTSAKSAPAPVTPPRKRRRPSVAPSAPMYSLIERYALDLLTEAGQRFPTNAAREEAVRGLAEEIDDFVQEEIYGMLNPADRDQAGQFPAEEERHAFIQQRLGSVEEKITWAMHEFRERYLAQPPGGEKNVS